MIVLIVNWSTVVLVWNVDKSVKHFKLDMF